MSEKMRGDGNAPAWADLVLEMICDEYSVPVPTLAWRRSTKHTNSSGTTYTALHHDSRKPKATAHRIVITAGSCKIDQYLVLIHEAAHVIAGHEHSHDATFWRICFKLFIDYGVPLGWAYKRESRYVKEAMYVGEQMLQVSAEMKLEARRFWNKEHVSLGRYSVEQYGPVKHPVLARIIK